MLSIDQLKHTLLDHANVVNEVFPNFAALDAHGSYSTIEFVLRLSVKNHQILNKYTDSNFTSIKYCDSNPELIQAFSTYVHETVHWWQHIGSSSGLVFSLSYPGQLHSSYTSLKYLLKNNVPNKSLRKWMDFLSNNVDFNQYNEILKHANFAVNNAIDVEFYKSIVKNPKDEIYLFDDHYYESAGHCYFIAYSHLISMLNTICDGNIKCILDSECWNHEMQQLKENKVTGYYYGSPLIRTPIGLNGIYEGQARLIQLQYLCYDANISMDELLKNKYFDGVYGEALKLYLEITGWDWPETIRDPSVSLFLLICDIAINPTEGFPFPISDFKNFYINVAPGLRFIRLCEVAKSKPELKNAIKNNNRDDYISIAKKLCDPLGWLHPMEALQEINSWIGISPNVQGLMEEHSEFSYKSSNLPVRVIFSHYISFSSMKLKRPEFFCWAGYWMSGGRYDKEIESMWLSQLSLFSNREDNEGVFPRMMPGKPKENIMHMFNQFYRYIMIYNLTKQWILDEGQFKYNYKWLSIDNDAADMEAHAKNIFIEIYGVSPDDFKLL